MSFFKQRQVRRETDPASRRQKADAAVKRENHCRRLRLFHPTRRRLQTEARQRQSSTRRPWIKPRNGTCVRPVCSIRSGRLVAFQRALDREAVGEAIDAKERKSADLSRRRRRTWPRGGWCAVGAATAAAGDDVRARGGDGGLKYYI